MNLISIYHDTKQKALKFPNKAYSKKYTENELLHIVPKLNKNSPLIYVLNKDTLDLLVELIIKGYKPCILNMASDVNPGGGVERGCSAQEENIFRRTNYFMTLVPNFYPITNSDTIYSKNVLLFKTGDETGYLDTSPMYIDIIASASVKLPLLDQYGLFKHKEDYDMQYKKISMILKTAIINNHDSIVLSAFGCGAYRCPPTQVAQLFKLAIKEYGSYFKIIVFAIKLPHDDPRDNFTIFYNEFVKL